MAEKFGNLGYDLLNLDKLIYSGLDPDPKPTDCGGESCEGGCTPSCKSCKNGALNG